MRKDILSTKEFNRMSNEYQKVKYYCECGHPVIIPVYVDKQICGWCGNYVFRDEKTKFKYKMKEKMRG